MESPKTILTKIRSLDSLTAIYMDTWQKVAENWRKRQGSVTNATR